MSAVAKGSFVFQASTSNAAGATLTGSPIDLRNIDSPVPIIGKITNGGTGPTVGASMQVQVSVDGIAWLNLGSPEVASTTNNAVTTMQEVVVDKEWSWARTVFTGNTGQAVTCEATGAYRDKWVP